MSFTTEFSSHPRPSARRLAWAWGLMFGLGLCCQGCANELDLFALDEQPAAPHGESNQGGAAGTGGEGTGGDRVDVFPGQLGGAAGFDADGVLAWRFIVHDKDLTGLGTQLRAVVFVTAEGNYPTNLATEGGGLAATSSNQSSDPYRAFDGDNATWWELRELEMPGWIRLDSTTSLPIPHEVFIDLHQHEARAPSDFDLDAFDGAQWWRVLRVRNLESWAEPGDDSQWTRDQRRFSLPPSEQWTAR